MAVVPGRHLSPTADPGAGEIVYQNVATRYMRQAHAHHNVGASAPPRGACSENTRCRNGRAGQFLRAILIARQVRGQSIRSVTDKSAKPKRSPGGHSLYRRSSPPLGTELMTSRLAATRRDECLHYVSAVRRPRKGRVRRTLAAETDGPGSSCGIIPIAKPSCGQSISFEAVRPAI